MYINKTENKSRKSQISLLVNKKKARKQNRIEDKTLFQ